MRHFRLEQWNDHVRGLVGGETARAMERHLAEGCADCRRRFELQRRLLRLYETDRRNAPPRSAVQAVQSLFRLQELVRSTEWARLDFRLAFDSLLAPARAATRSPQLEPRQLVYESDELVVDLQLLATGEGTVQVVGQLTAPDSKPLAAVPALLVRERTIRSEALTGSLGEFHLQDNLSVPPELCLVLADQRLVRIALPDLRAGRPAGQDSH